MRRPFLSQTARAAAAIALLLVAPLVVAQPITKEAKDQVLTAMSERITKTAYVAGQDLSKWDSFLADQRDAIEKAENVNEFVANVNRALNKFGFSHMQLMSPRAAEARRTRSIVGIGISIQVEPEGLRITALFDDAPAAQAGLQIGDLIMEVDGKKAEDNSGIAGDEGTSLELKVKKADGAIKNYTLTRKKFSTVRPETLTFVNDDTAVLKIPSFDTNYSVKRVDELMAQAQKAKNLIIDLRSNGGGAVVNMNHFLNHLLPTGTAVGTFVNRSTANSYKEATKNEPTDVVAIAKWSTQKVRTGAPNVQRYKGRIAVLINGGTGSASEITAAALKETLGVPVVGTKTAGAVLASIMSPLPNGFVLQMPLLDYVTIGGVRLEGNGVVPDVEAQTPRFNEADSGVEKALVLLQRAALRDERFGGGSR